MNTCFVVSIYFMFVPLCIHSPSLNATFQINDLSTGSKMDLNGANTVLQTVDGKDRSAEHAFPVAPN